MRSPEPPLVVGAGAMGREHVRALLSLGYDREAIRVVSMSEGGARSFEHDTGVAASSGGLGALTEAIPAAAVVAVPVPELAATAGDLLERGCRRILLEKPGALHAVDLTRLGDRAAALDAEIVIAYNRRFYASTTAARRLIAEDGGLVSCSFDFTEIEERVLAERDQNPYYTDELLARWGVVNSLHVIDLFLHLAGEPTDWEHRSSGTLSWHPAGAVFAGAGFTEGGAMFAYLSTWTGAGRWGVEATTGRRKLVLRPLEELRQQLRGSFSLEAVALEDEGGGLKPGFRAQLAAFLAPALDDPRLCRIEEALRHYAIAEAMLGYRS